MTRIAGAEKLSAAWREFRARTGWKGGKVNPATIEKNRQAARRRRKREAQDEKTTLTRATVRDVMEMDRAFREAVTE